MSSESTLTLGHLIIPILGLLIPIVAIVAHYAAKAYGDRQRHLSIREFARAGQPVPPELLAEGPTGSDHRNASERNLPSRVLLPAAVNLGLGLGLMGLFAVVSPGSWLWAIGFVPLCLGLCLLALWAVARKQQTGQ